MAGTNGDTAEIEIVTGPQFSSLAECSAISNTWDTALPSFTEVLRVGIVWIGPPMTEVLQGFEITRSKVPREKTG